MTEKSHSLHTRPGMVGRTHARAGARLACPAKPGTHASRCSAGVLLAILLAATALRLYRLDAGLWYDEIIADVEFVRAPFSTIVTTYESENQHFLYNILAHASYGLFGPSNWALRLPAVLFGLASILALYLLARRVTSTTESLLAAGLLSFSYHHIWFSQNARGYTGLLFWTLMSSWLLLRALRSGRRGQWLLYAVSVSLGLYTHFTMVFPIVGQLGVYGFELIRRGRAGQRQDWYGLFLGFGMGALLGLGLYAPVLPGILHGMGRETSLVAEWKSPLWTLAEIVKGLRIGFVGGIAAVAALAVFGVGAVSCARSQPAVLILLSIPVLACAAVVVGLGHHLWPRLFFFTLGFVVLVAVRGAAVAGRLVGQRVLRWPKRWSTWLSIAAGLGLVLISALSLPSVYGPKQDYEGALRFVQAARAPGDTVATADLAAFPYEKYYRVDWRVVKSVGELDTLRSGAARTWFVYTFRQVLESAAPDIMASLERDFKAVKTFDGTLSGGRIYVVRDK